MRARGMIMAVVAGLGMSGQAAAETGPERLFKSEDVFSLEYASDPRISPDGRRIVYERRANDIMTDRTRSHLWILDADGGNHRPLVTGRESALSPRWSPDGGRLAYVSSLGGEAKRYAIFVRWMDTGQTAAVAELDGTPDDIVWSPDGSHIAFTLDVETQSDPLAKAPAKPDGAEWAEPVKVIDEVYYRWDGRGYLEPAYAHVFAVPASGGTPLQLTSGDFNHEGPLSWTADSRRILFSANRHDDWEYETIEEDIFSVSLGDGALTQITDDPGAETDPAVSPDGRSIAFLKAPNKKQPYWPVDLFVMNRDGSGKRNLTDGLDRRVEDFQWSGNGTLYFSYDDRGVRKIARTDLSGRRRAVVSGIGGTTIGRPYNSGSFTVSGRGALAFTKGGPQRPADVATLASGRTRPLTRLNEDLLGHRDLGEVREIVYKSSLDGTEIQGWYITPPGFDPSKKYPLILEIHGGPHLAYGPHFAAELQRYAAEGYVVFYNNYRGSKSYGEKFALLLQYKYSSKDDFADQMSGIDALIEKGFIDDDNLFVMGGSAGGIATAYTIGLTDRFKAAVASKPVINWLSKTLTGDIYVYQIRHQFPAMPWEDPMHYWQRSPLSLVANVKTPTMLITGEQDFRTPISETEQFYQALKLQKVDTVMVRVPGSSHGIAGRPSRLIAKVDNSLAWLRKYRTDLPPEETKEEAAKP